MQNVGAGPLFDFRFRLRTLLYGITAVSLFLAICLLIPSESRFAVVVNAFSASSVGLSALAVWLANRNSPRYLGILIACHLVIAMFLLVGPILSYHVNGRAWHDYGISPWNPPPFHFSDGTIGISDYDPKFTRPAVWPVVGPVLYLMCYLSIGLMIVPPTAPLVSIASLVLIARLQQVLTTKQLICVWVSWAIGVVPVLYLVAWGAKVLEWIAD